MVHNEEWFGSEEFEPAPAYTRPSQESTYNEPSEDGTVGSIPHDTVTIEDPLAPNEAYERWTPQPVIVVQEQERPFVVRNSFATYSTNSSPTRIVAGNYVRRKIIIRNVGSSDVFISDMQGAMTILAFTLASGSEALETHTTEQLFAWSDTDSSVTVMEERETEV